MSTPTLTAGGFDKIHSLPSQNQGSPKASLYFLQDLTPEKIARAKTALEQKLQKNEQHQYTYEGDLQKFEEDIKEKPYLLKEGKSLQLLEGKKENTTEQEVIHQIKISNKTSYLFQMATIGGNFTVGNNANIVIHLSSFKGTHKPLNTSPLETLKKVYQQDPFVQRFSGIHLPLEESYIPLQIVEEKEQKEKEEKLRRTPENQGLSNQFSHNPHLLTFEDIFGAKMPIKIEDIFMRRGGDKPGPLRRLVLGKAGIGKTTFCKYTAYMWTRSLWSNLFDWVFWIPLREIKSEINLVNFIYHKWLYSEIDQTDFERLWRDKIATSNKVLLLLDGHDELPSEIKLSDFLKNFSSFHVLMTSRPINLPSLQNYQKFEITGFTDKDIKQFIGHCFKENDFDERIPTYTNSSSSITTTTTTVLTTTSMVTTTSTSISTHLAGRKEQLLQFLDRNPAINGIAHIPIQLDLLCTIWEDTELAEEFTKMTSTTMTTLYYKLEAFLLKKYLYSENKDVMDKPLRNRSADLTAFLARLAFSAIKGESLILSKALVNAAESNNTSEKYESGFLPEAKKLGVLQETLDKTGYYFLHLTLQEYYAASYLVSLLKDPQKKSEADQFIREEKYNRRMQLVFWFVAGLCRLEDDKATSSLATTQNPSLKDQFFQSILNGPQDLIGIYDAQLAVRLLEESGLPETKESQKFQEQIQRWITPKTEHLDEPFLLLAQVLKLSPHYMNKFCMPLYLAVLQKKGNKRYKMYVFNALRELAIIDDPILSTLLYIIQNPKEELSVKKAASYALEVIKVPDDQLCKAVNTQLNLVKDHTADPDRRTDALWLLGSLKLTEMQVKDVVSTLVRLIQDQTMDGYIQDVALCVLQTLKIPETQVKEVVDILLQVAPGSDKAHYIHNALCMLLRTLEIPEAQSKAVVNALFHLIQVETTAEYVKWTALNTLTTLKIPQTRLKELVRILLQLIEGTTLNFDFRSSIYETLSLLALKMPEAQRKDITKALLSPILTLDPFTDLDIKLDVGKERLTLEVPEARLKNVVNLLLQSAQDPATDADIKRAICWVLEHLKIPEAQTKDVVNVLLQLVQDPIIDVDIKRAICWALESLNIPEAQMRDVVNVLLQLAQNHTLGPVACWALGALKMSEVQVKDIVNTILQLIQDNAMDSVSRSAAFDALQNLEIPEIQCEVVVNGLQRFAQKSFSSDYYYLDYLPIKKFFFSDFGSKKTIRTHGC